MKKTAMTKPKGKGTSNQPAPPIDPSFQPIAAAFARDRQVSRKRVFGSHNVLTVKGKIFAMLVQRRLVVKLPQEHVERLVSARLGQPFDPGHGRVMKQWVSVPAGRADWVELAREAHRFVRGAAS